MNVVGRVVADVTDAAPRALTPGWAHGTWNGRHGRTGLDARITHVESSLEVDADGLCGDLRTWGAVAGGRPNQPRDWEHTGWFRRELTLRSGELRAYHGDLRMLEHRQRTGFGADWVEHSAARYTAAGVSRIYVHAALHRGGWAWARSGFVPRPAVYGPSADPVPAVVRSIVDTAHAAGRTSAAEHAATMAANPTTLAELAALPAGRATLTGSTWFGVRELHPAVPWWSPSAGADDAAEAVRAVLPAALDAEAARSVVLDALHRAEADVDPRRAARTDTRVELAPAPGVVTRVELPILRENGSAGWVHVDRWLREDGGVSTGVRVRAGLREPRQPRAGTSTAEGARLLAGAIRARLLLDVDPVRSR